MRWSCKTIPEAAAFQQERPDGGWKHTGGKPVSQITVACLEVAMGHRSCLTLVLVVPFRSTIWSLQSFAPLWAVPPAQDPSPTCDRENAGINPLPLPFKPKHGSTPPTCSKHYKIQSSCGPHGSHLRQPRQAHVIQPRASGIGRRKAAGQLEY